MYLAQIRMEDGKDFSVKLMNEIEIINATNEMDFNGIAEMKVFEVEKDFGKIEELHYLGWQPNCLIQYANRNDNIVISGYGLDH